MTAKQRAEAGKAEPQESRWPFLKSHYLGTESTDYHGHHEGDEVSALQEALDVKVTGTYDDATRDAVIEYQKAHKLDVTGIVDHELWDLLTR